jgi:hypothetical protein
MYDIPAALKAEHEKLHHDLSAATKLVGEYLKLKFAR